MILKYTNIYSFDIGLQKSSETLLYSGTVALNILMAISDSESQQIISLSLKNVYFSLVF